MTDATPAPAFARPDADAPWRPDAASLADHRATRLLTRTGEATLESLQARKRRPSSIPKPALVPDTVSSRRSHVLDRIAAIG